MDFPETPRQSIIRRHGALEKEQSSWRAHWQELNDYILPRRLRYLTSDVNKGTKRNDKIINLTPIRATRTLASGMMAGITSPARPWFRLTTPDPSLSENAGVKAWLSIVETRMREVFHRSNLYNCLPLVYTDLGVFGTSCMIVEEDPEDVVRGYVLPLGQYVLANSARLSVDTIIRKFQMTNMQLVQKFGEENVSEKIRTAVKNGNLDDWSPVLHSIQPAPPGDKYAFRSRWMEEAGDSAAPLLRDSGFYEFPGMAPRWNVTGEDVYGYSPGMDALGDARALQLYERRKAQAGDMILKPPMVGPSALRNQRASLLPGEWINVDVMSAGQSVKPAVEVRAESVTVFEKSIAEHSRRIEQAFYADLWLMLAASDRREITAREVDERHEEKMLQLGPVLERLHDELLDPLIDRVFNIMLRRGMFPPPPPELFGKPLRVEYISIMAQAQKLLFTTGIERLAGFVGNVAAVDKTVLRRVNFDAATKEYGALLGVAPKIIATDEEVAAKEQADQQQAAMAQAAQMAPAAQQSAQAAQVLSQTDVNKDSAFSRLMGALGGGVPPAPGV